MKRSVGLLLLIAGLAAASCARKAPAAAPESVPVRVGTVQQKSVPIEIRNIGTVQPFMLLRQRPAASTRL